jgi:TolA-binding protein
MKLLRYVLLVAVALAAASVAPTEAQQQPGNERARREARNRYFEARAPDEREQRLEAIQNALRSEVTKMKSENADLRKQNENLRADNEALRRQLEAYEARVRRQRENRGTFVIPPEALRAAPSQGGGVPESWKPFEFNGTTYYIVPLKDGEAATGRSNLLMETPAQDRPTVAKPAVRERATK